MYIRSISPIVASILIIVITVAIAGIFYAFTSGTFNSIISSSNNLVNQQSKIISFTINNVYCSNNILYFDIYNKGNIPININNSQIIFTDNYGNTISISGNNIICNNGNIINIGSNSLCYIINAFCYYSYTNYIKITNFVYNGINYNYEILNNKFNLVPFYPYFFQPTNPTISNNNSQGYLAQLPQCTITSNSYGGATGTYGLSNCIAIQNGAISIVVWFYEPLGGQGAVLAYTTLQYPNVGIRTINLYIVNGFLYIGDAYGSTPWQFTTSISPGWHMVVLEEWASSTSGPFYLSAYLDGQLLGTSSTSNLPRMFGNDGPWPYNNIGVSYGDGIWPNAPNQWWFFNGTIAYIALYNTVLNQTQVQQLYQSGFPNTLFSNNLVISYILDPTYYNNNSYYFIPYYVNTQLMSQMGINNYNATSITPNGNTGPIPSSQFVYEPNPPLG